MGNNNIKDSESAAKSKIVKSQVSTIYHPQFPNLNVISTRYSRHLLSIWTSPTRQIASEWQAQIKNEIEWIMTEASKASNISSVQQKQIATFILMPFQVQLADEQFCGNSTQVLASYPYQSMTLREEIKIKSKKNQPFLQSELWYLLYVLARSASFMHQRNTVIGDIRPINIFMDDERGIKIMGKYSAFACKSQQKGMYCDLNLLESRKQQRQPSTEQLCLSEDFSIGLTLLDCILLSSSSQIYKSNRCSSNTLSFNMSVYLTLMGQLSKIDYYSVELLAIVDSLCQLKTSDRTTSKEIYESLRVKGQHILNLSQVRFEDEHFHTFLGRKYQNIKQKLMKKKKDSFLMRQGHVYLSREAVSVATSPSIKQKYAKTISNSNNQSLQIQLNLTKQEDIVQSQLITHKTTKNGSIANNSSLEYSNSNFSMTNPLKPLSFARQDPNQSHSEIFNGKNVELIRTQSNKTDSKGKDQEVIKKKNSSILQEFKDKFTNSPIQAFPQENSVQHVDYQSPAISALQTFTIQQTNQSKSHSFQTPILEEKPAQLETQISQIQDKKKMNSSQSSELKIEMPDSQTFDNKCKLFTPKSHNNNNSMKSPSTENQGIYKLNIGMDRFMNVPRRQSLLFGNYPECNRDTLMNTLYSNIISRDNGSSQSSNSTIPRLLLLQKSKPTDAISYQCSNSERRDSSDSKESHQLDQSHRNTIGGKRLHQMGRFTKSIKNQDKHRRTIPQIEDIIDKSKQLFPRNDYIAEN